jgi:hypothetical protein
MTTAVLEHTDELNKLLNLPAHTDSGISQGHFDADTLAFVGKDLVVQKANAYKKRYAPLKMASGQILPIVIDTALAWADFVEVEEYDTVGISALISDYTKGGPRVGTLTRRARYPVKTIGNHTGYSWEEINKARAARKPLQQQRLTATREANDKYVNITSYLGDDTVGLPGIFNIPIQRFNSPITIDNNFSDVQIVGALNGFVSRLIDTTNELAMPRKIVLPSTQRNYLFNPRANTDMSIAETWLSGQREMGYITQIISDNNLKGKGTGGSDVMLILPDDPDAIHISIPIPYTILPEHTMNMEIVIHTVSRFGGVHCMRPMEIAMVEGI